MRDPVGAIVPGTAVTIFSGNQYQGGGNPGNQLQDGSAVLARRQGDANWMTIPMAFNSLADNNKYYSADLPADAFETGDIVEYYLRIAYDDHDKTFLHAADGQSAVTGDEATAQGAPYSFAVDSSAVRGHWGKVFPLPNVAIHAHLMPSGKVLFWGRRDRPDDSLDVHFCTPHIWDPSTGALSQTDPPKDSRGETINLFCSGHTFLSDGRLLVRRRTLCR
jgi:galactose oxidase